MNLSKYISFVRNAEEDKFTAIFAAVLANDQNLLKYLLKKLFEQESKKNNKKIQRALNQIKKIKKWKIDQQLIYSVGRFDITISDVDDNIFLILENKISSTEQKGQLGKYLNWANKHTSQAFVGYITLNEEEIREEDANNPCFLGHFYWSEIYEFIKQYLKKIKNEGSVTKSLCLFMEDRKMSTPQPFNGKDFENYQHFGDLYVKLYSLMQDIKKYLESKFKELNLVENAGRVLYERDWIAFKYNLKRIKGQNISKYEYEIGISLTNQDWKDFYIVLNCANREITERIRNVKRKIIESKNFKLNPQPVRFPRSVYMNKWKLSKLLTGKTFKEQSASAAYTISDFIKHSNKIIRRF